MLSLKSKTHSKINNIPKHMYACRYQHEYLVFMNISKEVCLQGDLNDNDEAKITSFEIVFSQRKQKEMSKKTRVKCIETVICMYHN